MASDRGAATPAQRSGVVARLLTNMESGEALALCRIGVVAALTASLLAHVGAVAEYFSAAAPVFLVKFTHARHLAT